MTKNKQDHPTSEPVEAEILKEEDKLEKTEELELAEGSMELEEISLEETIDVVSTLQEDLEEARAKADEYLDGWQRARAEFANYKKRVERDQSQVYQVASGNTIKRFLTVLDDLERALNNRPADGDGAVWAEGIELIYRKFFSILENEGVDTMQTEGQQFDPNLHEALSSEDSDQHESGEIIEVLQQGYTMDSKVLRPAVVRVAK